MLRRLLLTRHSCRGFLPDTVPQPTLERLFAIAQLNASWCNLQPWQTIVTTGAGTERLREALHRHAADQMAGQKPSQPDFVFPVYDGVYRDRRRETGSALYTSVGVPRGDAAAAMRQGLENYRFFGAPHAVIIHTEEALGTYGAIDCGGYVSTLLLAAQSLGLAAIAQAAFAAYPEFLRRYFDLPDHRQIVCGLSIGWEDTSHPANGFRTSRAGLAEAVRWVGE